jgi:two-component system sensor histidine kinase BarA
VFDNLGIKGRVLLLSLLPTTLLALVLGSYSTWVHLQQMQEQLNERGQLMAEQLAPLSARALAARDQELLGRLATQSLEQRDLRAIALLDPQGVPLAQAGPRMRGQQPPREAQRLSRLDNGQASRCRSTACTASSPARRRRRRTTSCSAGSTSNCPTRAPCWRATAAC